MFHADARRAARDRVRIAVRAFRVDINEPHLHGAQRPFQVAPAVGAALLFAVLLLVGDDHALVIVVAGAALAVADVAAEPCLLVAPVDVRIRLPRVLAAGAEAEESLEAHGFERDVSSEDQQVGPGNALAVLLLDRPEQAPGLVEAHVIRPTVERRETLLAAPGAAAAVADAVRAGTVPGHANEERAIVAEVRGPPFLRVGHHLAEVLLQCGKVDAIERLRVVEAGVHRIGLAGVLAERGRSATASATSRDSSYPPPAVWLKGHFASFDMLCLLERTNARSFQGCAGSYRRSDDLTPSGVTRQIGCRASLTATR